MSEIEELLSSRRSEEALALLDSAPESADNWALKGRALGQLERFQEALDCAVRALELNPECWEAHNTTAAILGRQGHYEEAFHHANLAASNEPVDYRFLSTRATILGMTGRLAEALADYDHIRELGQGAEFAAQRAQLLGAMDRADEALEALNEAHPERSDPEMLAQARAVIYSKLGNLPQAIEASLQAARCAPDRLEAWLQVVRLQCSQGDLNGALKTLDESLTLASDPADLWAARSQVLIAREEFDGVLEAIQTMREREPHPLLHYKTHLDLLVQAGQNTLVKSFLDQQIDEQPASADNYILRGVYSESLDEAETFWQKALALHPEAHIHYEVGNAYLGRGLLDKAAPYYEQTTELDPEHHEAFHNWGLCLQECGQLELAVEKYDRCLKLRPDLPDTYNNRGNCYRALAQHDLSLADHSRAIELYPKNPQPLQNRALTYIELRKLELAQADLTRLLQLDHQDAQGHHLLGLVHYLQDRAEHAKQHYDIACQLDRSFSERPYELMVKKRLTGPPPPKTDKSATRELDQAITELIGRLLLEGLKTAKDPSLSQFEEEELHTLLTFMLVASIRLLAQKSQLVLGPYFDQFHSICDAMDRGLADLKETTGSSEDALLGESATWISAQFPHHFHDAEAQMHFIKTLAVVVNSTCAQVAPIVTTYMGPVRKNWAKQAEAFEEKLKEMKIADLPFRYDLGRGQYYWLRDEKADVVADILVVGSYSEIGRSFMAGWANPGTRPGGAWPAPVPGLASSYQGLAKSEAWELAGEIANHLDVEFLQSVNNGRLVMFLGFSRIRPAEDGAEFLGANAQAAASDVLSKVSTLRQELGQAKLSIQALSQLCLDFSQRVNQLGIQVHKNTPIGQKLVKSSGLFKQLGALIGKKKFFAAKPEELTLEKVDECLELLNELERDWVS